MMGGAVANLRNQRHRTTTGKVRLPTLSACLAAHMEDRTTRRVRSWRGEVSGGACNPTRSPSAPTPPCLDAPCGCEQADPP